VITICSALSSDLPKLISFSFTFAILSSVLLSFISSLTNYTQEDEERKLRKTLGWIKQCNTIRGVNIQDLDEDLELYMEYLEHGI